MREKSNGSIEGVDTTPRQSPDKLRHAKTVVLEALGRLSRYPNVIAELSLDTYRSKSDKSEGLID